MRNPAIRLGLGGLAAIAALTLGALPAQASTAGIDGTTLDIEGDVDTDLITVSTDGTTLTVVDTGTGGVTEADTECATVNAQTVTCTINNGALPPVNRFEVELSNGVDSFTNQNFVTIGNGSIDADNPMGGLATGAKTILGGPGRQFIDGGLESDLINGGEGDDDLFDGGTGVGSPAPTGGNDVLDGGPGTDAVGYNRAGTAPLSLSLDDAANDGQAGETDNLIGLETIFSSNGDDTLTGNALQNTITGGGGNDLITGGGGNDLLFGEFAGGGAVRAGAHRGFSVLGPSNDTLVGGDGRDGLGCGTGTDVAIRDSRDEVDVTCERIGADVTGDSAPVTGKKQNKTKVELTCPDSEGATCAGKLKVTSNDKKVGKGKFSVAAGASKGAKVKLTKKGVKALKKADGSLLVSVEALTDEPGGVSQSVGTVLLFR